MVRLVQTAQFSQLIWLNAVAQVVVGLMQTAQREVQNTGRGVSGEPAPRRRRDRQFTQQT